jgi:hypothetical protein
MTLNIRCALPTAALALALGAGPLAAQGPAPAPGPAPSPDSQQQTMNAQGELLRVDLEKKMFWIEAAAGQEREFSFTDTTEVTGGAENVEGLAGKAGTRVTVEYRAEGGRDVATKIAIEAQSSDGPAPAPAPAPAPDAPPAPAPRSPQ